METMLRFIQYSFDFLWMIAPVVLLAVFSWRLAK